MNEHVSSLYVRAHELLNLGMDGSPIYSDHFARLNREVYEQALDLYNTLEGNTPEEEAELCLSILVALNATFYDNGRKQQYIQRLLDRCLNVLASGFASESASSNLLLRRGIRRKTCR